MTCSTGNIAASPCDLTAPGSGPPSSLDRIVRLAASVCHATAAFLLMEDSGGVAVKAVWGVAAGEAERSIPLRSIESALAQGATWAELALEALAREGPALALCAAVPIGRTPGKGMLCAVGTVGSQAPARAGDLRCLEDLAALADDLAGGNAADANAGGAEADGFSASARFSAVADAVSDAILTMDAEGIIRYASHAAHTVLGYRPYEIVGQSMRCIFGEETLNRFVRYFETKRKTLNWRAADLTVQHRTRGPLPVEVSIGEFKESDGPRLAVIVRDHSEESRLRLERESREREVRELFENLQEVVFRTDCEGRWTYLNPAWTRLTGFSVADSLGKPLWEFASPDERDQKMRFFREWTAGGFAVSRHDSRYRCADGTDRWIHVNVRRLSDAEGRCIGTCGTLLDIHKRRQAEERQREALDYAERCNAAKDEFLSRVSHELRTPMNAVLGFAQLLELEDLSELQARNVHQILRCGRSLLDLLSDLIDISRIESGKLQVNMEPVELPEAIGAALDLLQPLADTQGIRLVAGDLSGEVLADPRRLGQILLNLLSNAVKYNSESGSVEVWTEPAAGERVRISIRDTGPGLSPEQISRLFQPFERAGAERTSIPGTGLGLCVVKNLTELQGGRLQVVSAPGRGSTFQVEFEAAATGLPNPAAEAIQAAEAGQKIVLWIGSQAPDATVPPEIQPELPGVRVVASPSGGSALTDACEVLPDVILVEFAEGEPAALDVVKLLRGNPITGAIPIVGLGPKAAEPPCAEREIDDWVERPLDRQQLQRAVQRHLEKVELYER